jgi:hypothetical protein
MQIPPQEGMDGWIRTTLAITDAEIARTNGVDAAMYLMFFRLSSYVFGVAMVYGVAVLMPVYDSGSVDSVEGGVFACLQSWCGIDSNPYK